MPFFPDEAVTPEQFQYPGEILVMAAFFKNGVVRSVMKRVQKYQDHRYPGKDVKREHQPGIIAEYQYASIKYKKERQKQKCFNNKLLLIFFIVQYILLYLFVQFGVKIIAARFFKYRFYQFSSFHSSCSVVV